jgi:DnaJ-class molecular chaperone
LIDSDNFLNPSRLGLVDMTQDLYAILGLARTASPTQLKKAYHEMALRWHPDKNANNKAESQARFQEITDAYRILSNPTQRHIYDQYGENALQSPPRNSDPNPSAGFPRYCRQPSFNASFSTFSQQQRRLVRPEPIIFEVSCTLEELFAGISRDIRFIRTANQYEFEAILHLDIPAGSLDGATFTFPGEGNVIPGYLPQDVVVVLSEIEHEYFVREKDDLRTEVVISLKEALCGLDRTILGIDTAAVAIDVKSVICPGRELRIREQGMPRKGGGRGDLIVGFQIVYPKELDEDAKEHIAAYLPDV